ncbi:nucleotidyltransferase family protein [Fibrivirga algicola]|uniref:Nucleotidyltransferase family protein n=1 Tax=Fibrivirga algicola TaxID=2950420 RepID=A0ABX0QEZ4_9BACT|nr:nucleotidyltransferase family protein [Fibrivirga algicola]NID10955.1 nucleotidyltransferase family protein [Fibrivirga algicola]
MTIGTLILAAGESSRLGQPKQLLEKNGQPLVRHMAQLAHDLNTGPVVVVVGANAEPIKEALHDIQVRILPNPDWKTGMASSLRVGVELLEKTFPEAILVLLTDQPYVSRALIEQLIETATSTHKGIIASEYGDTLGVPVLFRPEFFEALKSLEGDTGARKLVQKHPDDVAGVPFEQGAIDLDTPEDVANWQAANE